MTPTELQILEEKFRYAFYGMLVFLALLMLIQYLQNQRKLFYLYYALYVLGLLFAFEPHFTPVKNAYIHFIEWLVVLFYFLFIHAFLELSAESRRFRYFMDYYRYGFWALFLAQTGMVIVKEQGVWYGILEWLTEGINYVFFILSALGSFYVMWEVSRLRTVLSRYVLLAMFLLTIGMVTNQLMFSIFSIYVLWGCIFLELILFALAIGYKAKLTEQQKMEAQEGMMRATLTSLRQQMNPHFISNSLNSIKHLIQREADDEALECLGRFSQLHRLVVTHFRSPRIPLDKELEICRYYLEMEKLRFKASFRYEIAILVDENVLSFVEAPPLLLLPLLESAIWPGVLPLGGEKHLRLLVEQRDSNVCCIIEHNGIQRGRSSGNEAVNSLHEREGIRNTREKIRLFRELYRVPMEMNILEKLDADGKQAGVKLEVLIGM